MSVVPKIFLAPIEVEGGTHLGAGHHLNHISKSFVLSTLTVFIFYLNVRDFSFTLNLLTTKLVEYRRQIYVNWEDIFQYSCYHCIVDLLAMN